MPPSQRSILFTNLQLTYEPGLAAIVAAKFSDRTRELLVIEPKAIPFIPLEHSKIVAWAESFNNVGIAPRSGVSDVNHMAFEIAIVNLELYFGEGDGTERSVSRRFSRVEYTFKQFRLTSDGYHFTRVIN
jgi:hypothetical protein